LTDEKTWNDLQQDCPGINKGDLVQLEVIEARAAEREL